MTLQITYYDIPIYNYNLSQWSIRSVGSQYNRIYAEYRVNTEQL